MNLLERLAAGRPRRACALARGYHVFYENHWHLVESVLVNGSSEIIVEFCDAPLLFIIDPNVPDAPRYPSRSPREQIAATSFEERRRALPRKG
jgi:hypothetical protein